MNDLTFNTASLPVYQSIEEITSRCNDIFRAISVYIGEEDKPRFFIERSTEQIFLNEGFSLENFIQNVINYEDRDLADFIFECADTFNFINTQPLLDIKVNVGDDTRYQNDVSLKHACVNNNILFTVTNEKLWQRKKIEFTIFGSKIDSQQINLFNLYNFEYSHLPSVAFPYLFSDTKRFARTNKIYDKQSIYKEIATNFYWYYDYFHKDNKEHFEVFDRTGNHLGEASNNGVIDFSKADSTKSIKSILK